MQVSGDGSGSASVRAAIQRSSYSASTSADARADNPAGFSPEHLARRRAYNPDVIMPLDHNAAHSEVPDAHRNLLSEAHETIRTMQQTIQSSVALLQKSEAERTLAEQRARDAEAQLQHIQRQNATAQAGRAAGPYYGSYWVKKDGTWQEERFQFN